MVSAAASIAFITLPKAREAAATSKQGARNVRQIQERKRSNASPSKTAIRSNQPAKDQVSAISRGITVVGRIFGEGTVEVFGRIEGELRASTVSIQAGAQVDGDVVAEDLIIAGQVKGTIHADRVKLNSTALVEGDIFHRSLSIEENARFEGSSKREDKTPAVQDRDDEAVDLPRPA